VAKRCEESSKGDGSLQIMYGIHGEHELTEVTLDHLDGYKKSRPVRIGNGAYNQVQLDIYGELLDTVYLSNKSDPHTTPHPPHALHAYAAAPLDLLRSGIQPTDAC
jgi:GH15 family glucan-1,4-alpha-glucosidase